MTIRSKSAGSRTAAAFLLAAVAVAGSHLQAHAEDMKAAMLLPGSFNDQSWNAMGYSGLKGIEGLGFTIAVSENVPDSDDASAMRDYADQGYNIVLGHSGRFLSAATQVGPDYPEVQFIVGGGAEGMAPNVMSIDYDNAQFGCLLGHLAAKMSKTGKVGGVYGLEGLANIVAQAGGFRICAMKANPNIEVTLVYLKSMEDAASAKEAALSLIADGADVITGKLNAAQSGLIQAAKEKGVFATGRSLDSTTVAPDSVLVNVLEQWDQMYAAAAEGVKDGKMAGTFVKYGFATADKTTGASLNYNDGAALNPIVPEAVVAEIKALEAEMASGKFEISPTPQDARGGK